MRTAFTRDPYPDDPNYHGVPATTKERLMSNVLIGNRNDWRFSIHSVGDAAIDWVLDAYEAADKDKSIADRRFACMHCSLIRKDQLERMKRLGVILELQNAFMWTKQSRVKKRCAFIRSQAPIQVLRRTSRARSRSVSWPMVVLDRDYFTIPDEQIKDVTPLQTIVGGAVVYRR